MPCLPTVPSACSQVNNKIRPAVLEPLKKVVANAMVHNFALADTSLKEEDRSAEAREWGRWGIMGVAGGPRLLSLSM